MRITPIPSIVEGGILLLPKTGLMSIARPVYIRIRAFGIIRVEYFLLISAKLMIWDFPWSLTLQ
jgi:hypothetical protein